MNSNAIFFLHNRTVVCGKNIDQKKHHTPQQQVPEKLMELTDDEVRIVLDDFERRSSRGEFGWTRRTYAHNLIFTDSLSAIRESIQRAFPQHVIAFDVVFESSGTEVGWHADYESLGVFETEELRSVLRNDFMSVHFNLTEGGGSLRTLPWPFLSYLHWRIIATFGIFSYAHRTLVKCCAPLLERYATIHPSTPRVGNAFDNMRLHSVTSGARRVSYVVRLVRKGTVFLTKESLERGMQRSEHAQRAFAPLRSLFDDDGGTTERRVLAHNVPWSCYGA